MPESEASTASAVTVTITLPDLFLTAWRITTHSMFHLVLVLIAFSTSVDGCVKRHGHLDGWMQFALSIGFIAAIWMIFAVVIGILAAVHAASGPGSIGPHTFQIQDDGLLDLTPESDMLIRWNALGEATKTSRYLLLRLGGLRYIVIPLRAFPDARSTDFFCEQVQTRISRKN